MGKYIEFHVIEEGHVRAVKSQDTFGGCNKWYLHLKDIDGYFRQIQWMDVDNIQQFFKTKLPIYEQIGTNKFKIVV